MGNVRQQLGLYAIVTTRAHRAQHQQLVGYPVNLIVKCVASNGDWSFSAYFFLDCFLLLKGRSKEAIVVRSTPQCQLKRTLHSNCAEQVTQPARTGDGRRNEGTRNNDKKRAILSCSYRTRTQLVLLTSPLLCQLQPCDVVMVRTYAAQTRGKPAYSRHAPRIFCLSGGVGYKAHRLPKLESNLFF